MPDAGTGGGAVLLVTSNGIGLGHLARMTAVAQELSGRGVEPVLASMSAALPLVLAATGLRGEHVPSPRRGWVDARRYPAYLTGRIALLAREVGAQAVVFDGVVPYAGLLAARSALPDVRFVWSRRGFWKPGPHRLALRSAAAFDQVVEPGDLGGDADTGPTRGQAGVVRVPPVSLAVPDALLPRGEARRRLGLDPDRPTALVTLGASPRGDLSGAGRAAVTALLADPRWQVAVTSLPVGREQTWTVEPAAGGSAGRVVELSGVFPLVPLLRAFDAAVGGAGYNAVHELLPAGLPTLLVAKDVGVDDQLARGRAAADRGWALLARDDDPGTVADAAGRLRDEDVRRRLAAACAALPPVDGASAAADAVLGLGAPSGRERAGPGLAGRAVVAELRLRTAVAARRSPSPTAAPRVAPLVTGGPAYADLLGERPVEDVLRGSSPAYLARRSALARRAYGAAPPVAGAEAGP